MGSTTWQRVGGEKFVSPSLAREIILALLGHHGNVIVVKKSEEMNGRSKRRSFELHPDFPIHEGDREVITRVCKLGALYESLTLFASSSFKSLISPSLTSRRGEVLDDDFQDLLDECDGFYFRGFCRGLDELLEGYRECILELEQLWLQEPSLPLIFVLQPLQQWEIILPHLQSLTQSIRESHLRGNELLDLVHDHCLTCSIPLVSQTFVTLQNRCRNILYNQILEWMTQGNLNDPFEEFFIQRLGGGRVGGRTGILENTEGRRRRTDEEEEEDEEDEDEDEEEEARTRDKEDLQLVLNEDRMGLTLWDSFDIRSTMLPSFIPPSVAEKVLFVGKAVLLLNHASKRTAPSSSSSSKSSNSYSSPSSATRSISHSSSSSSWHSINLHEIVSFGKSLESLKLQSTPFHLPSFEQTIDQLRQRVSSRLWNFIVLDSNLVAQLRAFKDYFLLSKGDLWQTFIEQSKSLLSLPPSSNARMDLTALLRSSASLISHKDTYFSRLSFTFSHTTSSSSHSASSFLPTSLQTSSTSTSDLWESGLGLKLRVSWPLSILFTKNIMEKYESLFRFLFKMKRVQLQLQHIAWKAQMQCKRIPFQSFPHSSSTSPSPSPSPSPSLGNNAALRSLWHLRNKMVFIVNNLQYYFYVDVLEVQFSKLVHFLERPDINDFEKARQAHEDYLETLSNQCFLQVPAISRCLNQILALCSTYCTRISMGDVRFLGIHGVGGGSRVGSLLGEGQIMGQELISREFDKQASLLAAMLAGVRMSSASASLAQIINSEKYSRFLTATASYSS